MRSLGENGKAPALRTFLVVVAISLLAGLTGPRGLADEPPSRTSVSIVVKDAKTGEPIANAQLTLQFRLRGDPAKLKRGRRISYNAKTNPQGRYKFTEVPKGTILLFVKADRHQTFGQEFEIEQDNQVIEVKLRTPQPLL